MTRMTDRQYEFWTRLCLLIAIGSSIGFEKTGGFTNWVGWLVGGIGMAAGVVGSAIYFRNVVQSDRESNVKRQPSPPSLKVGDLPSGVSPGPDQLAFWHMQHTGEIRVTLKGSTGLYLDNLTGTDYFVSYAYRNWAAHHDLVHYNWVQAEVAKRPREHEKETFVDEVVEIVKRLSPECELEFDREHRVTIRPRARAANQVNVPFALGIRKEHGSA